MSGETEREESGWTVDTLKYLTDERIDALDGKIEDLRIMLDERYSTQVKAVEQAFLAQQTAMQTAFTAADLALDRALSAAEKALEQRASHLDREFHEHLEQVRHENSLAFETSDKAIQAAFAASAKAIDKAETAAEKRFEAVNEFRAQLADQAATLVTRVEADAERTRSTERLADVNERLNAFENRISNHEGNRTGSSAALGAMLAVATLFLSVVVFAANYLTSP